MDTTPHIVILAPRRAGSGLGGAERHIAELGGVLSSLGARVQYVSRDEAGSLTVFERLLTRAVPLLTSCVCSRKLARSKLIWNADLVLSIELMGFGLRHARHLHLFFGSYSGFIARALEPPKGRLGIVKRRINLLAARWAERRTQGSFGSLANSRWLRDVLREERVAVRDEVIVPPTDLRHYRPGDARAARTQLRLPEQGRLLVFAGRWEYAKGADRAARALDALPSDWQLVIACPSDTTWPLPRDRTIVLRDVAFEHMPLVYAAADVLIQPSRFEGYSLVVSEAQACGVPVVTSDVGQASHLAAEEIVSAGIVHQPDDPLEWVRAIDRVTTQGEAAAKAARRFAERTVSRQAVAAAWVDLLHKLLPEYEWLRPI